MNDELKIEEEKIEFGGSKKMIDVTVLKIKDKTVLVSYVDEEGEHRVYLPTSKLKDDQISEQDLKKGMPHGLPWEKVELPEVTGEQLAAELRKRNIWTAEDLRTNPSGARAAINALYGKPLAIITQFAKEQVEKSK